MKLIIALILGVIVSFGLYKKGVFAHKEKSEFYEAGAGVVTAAIAFALLALFTGGSPADVADEKLAVNNDVKVTEKEDKKDKDAEEVKEKDVEKDENKDKKDVKDKDKDSKKKEENEETNKKADSSKKADNKASDSKKTEAKKSTSNSNVKAPSKNSSTKPNTGSSTKPSAPSKKPSAPSAPSNKPAQSKPSAPSKQPSKTEDKVEYKKHKSQDEIYYSTKYEDTDSLYIGEQKVKVKGQNGYVVTEYTDKYVNGQWTETTSKVIDKKDKVDEVILTGTKMKKNINDSESRQVFNAVNAYRKSKGIAQLQWDEGLYNAAKLRAEELTEKLDHTRPNGTSHSTAINEFGVVYDYSGENIAAWQGSVNEVMNSWKNSRAHNGNMLSSDYTHMASAKMETSNGDYWVQLFIKR